MSIEALRWAIEEAPPMPAQLVGTLIGLANHADAKGRGAYPSLRTLGAYACKAERSIRRDLRELAGLGLIRPGDAKKTDHLPADKRPEVYDLALELIVPGGRAGKDEGTRASARTQVSARARGGKKKPSSDDMRADVHVRGDADDRPDVDVTSGRTSTSQRGDAHVRQTVFEPPFEPSSLRAGEGAAPVAAVDDEREIEAAPDNDDTAKVVAAWTTARGRDRNPDAEAQIRASARVLLAAGWSIPDLIALAEDMAKRKPTYTNLGKHEPHWVRPVERAAPGSRPSMVLNASGVGDPECANCGRWIKPGTESGLCLECRDLN